MPPVVNEQPKIIRNTQVFVSDATQSFILAAMKNQPERFRPEVLRFCPTLANAVNGTDADAVDLSITTQPEPVRIHNEKMFVMTGMSAYVASRSNLPSAGGGAPPLGFDIRPADLDPVEITLRDEGAMQDLFTTPVPLLSIVKGMQYAGGEGLDFSPGFYVFNAGASIRVSFTLRSGVWPLLLQNATNGVGATADLRAAVAFGVLLKGVVLHRSYWDDWQKSQMQGQPSRV